MLGVLSAFDFLNSREKAIVMWAVILVGFAAYKSDGLASSLGALLRSLFVTKLVFLFGTAAAYCTALVLAANKLGLWHTSAIKATIYWFLMRAAKSGLRTVTAIAEEAFAVAATYTV